MENLSTEILRDCLIGLAELAGAWYYISHSLEKKSVKVKIGFLSFLGVGLGVIVYPRAEGLFDGVKGALSPWEGASICLSLLLLGIVIYTVKLRLSFRKSQVDKLNLEGEIRNLEKKNSDLQEALATESAVVSPSPKCIYVFIPRKEDAHNSFWLAFTKSVHDAVTQRGYSCRVEPLRNDYATREQIVQLKEFVDTEWNKASGIIVSLADQNVMSELMDIVKRSGIDGKPIVLHDLAPEAAFEYYTPAGITPNLVCVDNEEGGRMAATIMLESLHDAARPFNLVCVQGSSKHPHSKFRLNGFEEHLKSVLSPGSFTLWPIEGGWTMEGAEAAFAEFIAARGTPRLAEIHGVFALNDEMALGVDNVIARHNRRSNTQPIIKVVGFDNIEMLHQAWRMRTNCTIVGTVNAELKQQARQCVDLVMDLIQTGSTRKNIRNISPSIEMRPKN